jgi:hypothetical protein
MTTFNVDKEISKAHTAAAGWGLEVFEDSNPFECHCIYVVDFRQKKPQPRLMTIKKADMAEISMAGNPTLLASKAVAIQNLINSGKPVEGLVSHLMTEVATYLKCTETYRLWVAQCGYEKRFHAVLNIYRAKGDKRDGVFRPALAGSEELMLTPKEVAAMSEMMLKRDRVSPAYSQCKF